MVLSTFWDFFSWEFVILPSTIWSFLFKWVLNTSSQLSSVLFLIQPKKSWLPKNCYIFLKVIITFQFRLVLAPTQGGWWKVRKSEMDYLLLNSRLKVVGWWWTVDLTGEIIFNILWSDLEGFGRIGWRGFRGSLVVCGIRGKSIWAYWTYFGGNWWNVFRVIDTKRLCIVSRLLEYWSWELSGNLVIK